jgi:threonine dehydrogenase-like Zn-dependent dehydrogenase
LDKKAISFDGETYNDVIRRRKTIMGSWIYDSETWVRVLSLVERNMIDLNGLISHRLPLDDAVKGFELSLKQQCVKVILIP